MDPSSKNSPSDSSDRAPTRAESRSMMHGRVLPLLLGVILPGALMAASLIASAALNPRIPNPAVLHWGPSGPDRFGPFTQNIVVMAVISAVMWAMLSVLALATATHHAARAMGTGIAAASGTLLAALTMVTTLPQVDAPSAIDVQGPSGWAILAGFIGAIVVGIAAGAAVGKAPDSLTSRQPGQDSSDRVPLLDIDPADPVHATFATGPAHPKLWWLIAGAWTLGGIGLAYGTGEWWVAVVFTLPAGAVLATLNWTITVDRERIRARATAGFPRLTLSIAEVSGCQVCQVRPFSEFGGWGLRVRLDGSTGIVVRTGEALKISAGSGNDTYITLDDAAHAAALINTLIRQQSPHHR